MSVTFEVAHTHEQGVDFVVVLVRSSVLNSPREQAELTAFLEAEYGPIPVVFASQQAGGRIDYLGRPDLARFLSRIGADQLPWERVTFSTAA